MKILLIVPGGVDKSGQERVIPALLWLIERLARQHEVLVIALHQYERPCTYHLHGAQIINLGHSRAPLAELRLPGRWRQIMHAIRSFGVPDVVHGFWAQESGVLAGLVGRRLRRPVVLSIGGGELTWLPQIGYGLQGQWRGRLRVWAALQLATAVTGGSQFVLQTLPAMHKATHWLPLGAATELFTGSGVRQPGPPWRLVHVATINPVKDQATLLHALAIARQQVPDIRLDWVGEDTLNGRLQTLAQQLNLTEAVTFHRFLPSTDLIPLYQRAHLFVQSSLHESQGVAVCEAAACGVPTVGTKVGLVAELAPLAATAVPIGDAPALASAMLHLLANPAERESLAHAAQQWAQTHNADWTAAQFIALYQHLQAA
ncbi:MAG: glycosyltransferase family 4 protein [Anaerolineales bacterium]|nr:glycosyltransferase family 4 protein [Anaerolineales bacterium]